MHVLYIVQVITLVKYQFLDGINVQTLFHGEEGTYWLHSATIR